MGAAIGALALTGASALWIGLRVGGQSGVRAVDDTVTVLAAALATTCCLGAARRDRGLRLFWSLLGAACLSWTLAEVVWGVYDVVLSEPVPVPSWADVGYLAAIPIAVGALLAHPALRRTGRRNVRALLDSLIVATALGFLSWTLVIGPLWRTTDLSTIGGLVALAYPFGDVVIVFFIVTAVRRMPRGHRLALWCLLGGLLIMALSDSTYVYLTTANSYASGDLIDIGWIAAYMAIALSAFSARATQGTFEQARAPAPRSALTTRAILAPFVIASVALAIAAVKLRLGHPLDGAESATAVGLISLVVIRHAVLMWEVVAERPTAEAGWITELVRVALGRPRAGPSEAGPPVRHASARP